MSSSRSYPDHPFVGVSALIQHEDHIVLIERGNEPHIGIWSLPGGAVETGERLEEATKREILEETGIDFKPDRLADIVEILRHDASGRCERHFVINVFFCDLSNQTAHRPALQAGDDARDARWVSIDALGQCALTDGTLSVIQRILSGAPFLL